MRWGRYGSHPRKQVGHSEKFPSRALARRISSHIARNESQGDHGETAPTPKNEDNRFNHSTVNGIKNIKKVNRIGIGYQPYHSQNIIDVSYYTVKASVSLLEYRAVSCQAIHTRIICSVGILGRSSKALDSIKCRKN